MAKKSKRNNPSAFHRRMVGATADDTHYLLIVHGTWNSYDRVLGTPQQKWYWSEEASSQLFVDQLRARLQGTELANAVWRKVPGIDWPFSWSGQNSHKARIAAAQELCKIMIQIVTVDPTARLHFVAHSHGGNVLLKSLELYLNYLGNRASGIVDRLPHRLHIDTNTSELMEHLLELPEEDSHLLKSRVDTLGHLIDNLRSKIELPETVNQFRWSWSDYYYSAKKLFIDEWQTSGTSNRVGKLIFIGVPFLRRELLRPSRITQSVGLVGHFAGIWFIAYLFAVAFGVAQYTIEHFRQLSLDINVTSLLSQAVGRTWAPFIFLSWLTLAPSRVWLDRYNVRDPFNFYFDPWILELRHPARPPFMDALVLSAPKVDEALLCLSSDRIAYAGVIPTVRNLLFPPIRSVFRWPSLSSSLRPSIKNNLTYLAGLPFRLIGVFFRLTGYLVTYPLNRFLVSAAAARIVKVLSAVSTGLPIDEFTFARVTSRPSPELPSVISERYEDVTEAVLREQDAPVQSSKTRPSGRFPFLDDPELLEQRIATSRLWASIRGEMAQARQKFQGVQEGEAEDKLEQDCKMACLAIEERAAEAFAATDFNHARYYDNPAVLGRMVEFLLEPSRSSTLRTPNWQPRPKPPS